MILLGFQSLESAHLKDIKSTCILRPQEVTVTICVLSNVSSVSFVEK